MFETAFRSDDLPQGERFDRWRCRMPDLFRVRTEHTADFYAHERHLPLGGVRAATKSYRPMELRRASASMPTFVPDLYELVVPFTGSVHAALAGRDIVTRAGGLYVHEVARVREVAFRTPDSAVPYEEASLTIPKSMLTLPAARVEGLLGERIPLDDGFGALLSGFIKRLTAGNGSFGPSDGPRLGTIAVDLVSALFGNLLSAESTLEPETRTRTLFLRIAGFIQQHLAEPGLTPQTVAEAHHISVSYLHRLFQPEGVTVAVFIRRQRLERARRALAEDSLRGMPVRDIAAHSGFTNAADFSRAFKAAYGLPPRDYRRRTLGGDV